MVLLPHQARLSANAKLNRAVEHLQMLRGEVEAFRARDTHVIARRDYYDRVPGALVSEWVVEVIETPPLAWSTLIGDFLHNARSALDHLVWGVSGPTPRHPRKVGFPIFADRDTYLGSVVKPLADVPEAARVTIEDLQPFMDPDGEPTLHPLWLLHELSNADKHRVLNVVQKFPAKITVEFDPPIPNASTETFAGALEHEAVVARATIPRSAESTDVAVSRRIEHTECIQETATTPLLPIAQGLTLIGLCVEEAVEALGAHLPNQSTWGEGGPGSGQWRWPPM